MADAAAKNQYHGAFNPQQIDYKKDSIRYISALNVLEEDLLPQVKNEQEKFFLMTEFCTEYGLPFYRRYYGRTRGFRSDLSYWTVKQIVLAELPPVQDLDRYKMIDIENSSMENFTNNLKQKIREKSFFKRSRRLFWVGPWIF